MVIENVQDLYIGPVPKGPVGDVCLPPFVGLVGFEPNERAPGALLRLGGDEPPAGEDPPDRGRRRGDPSTLLNVVGDGVRPGVQATFLELFSQPDDLFFYVEGCLLRIAVWAAGAWCKSRLPFSVVTAG